MKVCTLRHSACLGDSVKCTSDWNGDMIFEDPENDQLVDKTAAIIVRIPLLYDVCLIVVLPYGLETENPFKIVR